MPFPSCRQSWLMQGLWGHAVHFSDGGHGHGGGHGPAVKLAPVRKLQESIQPVEGSWNEKDLREQFHDCLRNQEQFPDVAKAEVILKQMRLRDGEFLSSEIDQYQEILDSAKEHETIAEHLATLDQKDGSILADSAGLLTKAQVEETRLGRPYEPIASQVGSVISNERLHYCNQQLAVSRASLKQQYEQLIQACKNTHDAAQALDETFRVAVAAFRNRSMTFNQMLKSVDAIEKKFEHISHENHKLKAHYLEKIPVLQSGYFIGGSGKEAEDMKRLLRLRRLMRAYNECGKGITTIQKLDKTLTEDTDGKHVFRLTKGAAIRLGDGDSQRTVRIIDTHGEPDRGGLLRVSLAGSSVWMQPGELYFHLLMETGFRCNLGENVKEAKVKGARFMPSLETLEDLQKAIGFDPVNQPLKPKGQEVVELTSSKMSGNKVVVGKVDDPRGTVSVAHSYNQIKKEWSKVERMSFQEFLDFKNKFGLKYPSQQGPERTWDATYWNRINTTKPKNTRSLLSIAGIAKGMKMVAEGFKRMGGDRTEINGANFARWASKKVEGFTDALGIPWTHGIMDTVQNQAIDLIMGKIDKWANEYRKLLKTGELEGAFTDFYKLPKWRQAALLLAAGDKGLSKPEVIHLLRGEGLDASKWKDRSPTNHGQYVGLLYEYFADEGDASGLPQKIESRLTPALNNSYGSSVKTGFEESVNNFEFNDTMDLYRSYFVKPKKVKGEFVGFGHNMTKRKRAAGPIQSALKLGIGANELGRMVLWMYSTVESSVGGKYKQYSNFDGQMMRGVGNMGKYMLPMMGLYRFPRGMALARAMIDFYTECTGESPFNYEPGKANDAEITLGYLFSGQWQMIEDKLKAQIGPDNTARLKYMYMKARAFCYYMEEGAPLSLHLPAGADLDEDTLTDAYGVSGMLSRSWLATVMKTDESGSGAADHHNWVYAERAGQWWDQLPNKIKEVTPTEQKLFAHNFWEILYEDIAVRDQLFRRHWKSIGPIMKYLTPGEGPVIVEFAGSPGATRKKVTFDSRDPNLVERINEALHHMQHEDPGVYITDLHLNAHSWLQKTKDDIGKDPHDKTGLGLVFRDTVEELQNNGVGNFIDDGHGGAYNLDIPAQIKKEIDESKNWRKKVVEVAEKTNTFHIKDRQTVREQVGRVTGDNFAEDPSLTGGYSEGTD